VEVANAGDAEWIESRASRGWRFPDVQEVFAYRELIGFLALRDIRARYKQAVLGVAWTILQPVAGTVALLLVFRQLIDVTSDGIPYALFALLGYSLWSYVSGTVGRLTGSLLGDVDLVTKVYFPRVVIPLAASLPGLVDLAVGLVVLAVLMVIAAWAPPLAVVLLPLVVVFAVVIALGAGLWLATLNVLYRDVGHALGFALHVWFFASPVAYPSSLVPPEWRHLYALNPVAGLIDAGRAVVLGSPLRAVDLAISTASALVLLAGGIACFQRSERRFADVI